MMARDARGAAGLPLWLQEPYDSFSLMRSEQRLPHALILNCPAGWGETRLASLIATELLSAPASLAASELAHPDLHWLRREEGSLLYKVAQIREAVAFMQRTAAGGGYKVIVVPAAQRMNEESANTLLKSLEEPPSGGMWLLLCPDIGQLLATIRSRCQLISIRPTPDLATDDFVRELLRDADAEERWDADALSMLRFELGGAPERVAQALSLDEEPIWPQLREVIAHPELIGKVSQTWQPRALAELLSSWLRYVHSIVAGHPPEYVHATALSEATRAKFFEFADELTQARILAMRHVGINGRLVLDRLLGRWLSLFDKEAL